MAARDPDSYFAERGHALRVEETDDGALCWAHLVSVQGDEVDHPRYGRGKTGAEVKARALGRWTVEQEPPELVQRSGVSLEEGSSLASEAVKKEADDDIAFVWRGPLDDSEMVDLVVSHGGHAEQGWWERTRPHSLGWVTARTADGTLVGFANVAWDGSDHAFLLDPKTRGTFQRRGIGRRLVSVAIEHARAAGCEWLHVDFDPELRPFYLDACRFAPTDAGLIHLPSRT